jgi:hypothetical protein
MATEHQVRNTPWHLYVVGTVAFLWYAMGAATIQMAQLAMLPGLDAGEIAYYAAKPIWLVTATAVGTYGSVLGSLLLLMRSRAADAVFGLSLAGIMIANIVELLNGTSRAFANDGAALVTLIVAVGGLAVWSYAYAMVRNGVLR